MGPCINVIAFVSKSSGCRSSSGLGLRAILKGPNKSLTVEGSPLFPCDLFTEHPRSCLDSYVVQHSIHFPANQILGSLPKAPGQLSGLQKKEKRKTFADGSRADRRKSPPARHRCASPTPRRQSLWGGNIPGGGWGREGRKGGGGRPNKP